MVDLAKKRRPMPPFAEDLFPNYPRIRIPIPKGDNHMTTVLVPFPLEDALYRISVHLLIIPTQSGIQS